MPFDPSPTFDVDSPHTLISIISPFLRLPHVTSFSVTTNKETWLVDDDGLRVIGDAWPELVSLHVSCKPVGVQEPVAASIHGIAALARRCTGLRSVKLSSLAMLRAARIVEAPYLVSGNRWLPDDVDFPEDRVISNIDVARLVDILWPLFGVAYSPAVDVFSEKWRAVLREVVRVQNEQEKEAGGGVAPER
ncbi:hypothetical protein FOMPIDRAFT_1025622 [Fomitopsis schrenkii]|uniref:Uncharacterized protein n=1 Tax=Fomitopsis schrenkii TaxID=2126942 RepID=S8DT62_FOMSC|nr:hypothetical protein FOMPIDRAFT_1025622 [Fomitopsis schrenkii]